MVEDDAVVRLRSAFAFFTLSRFSATSIFILSCSCCIFAISSYSSSSFCSDAISFAALHSLLLVVAALEGTYFLRLPHSFYVTVSIVRLGRFALSASISNSTLRHGVAVHTEGSGSKDQNMFQLNLFSNCSTLTNKQTLLFSKQNELKKNDKSAQDKRWRRCFHVKRWIWMRRM